MSINYAMNRAASAWAATQNQGYERLFNQMINETMRQQAMERMNIEKQMEMAENMRQERGDWERMRWQTDQERGLRMDLEKMQTERELAKEREQTKQKEITAAGEVKERQILAGERTSAQRDWAAQMEFDKQKTLLTSLENEIANNEEKINDYLTKGYKPLHTSVQRLIVANQANKRRRDELLRILGMPEIPLETKQVKPEKLKAGKTFDLTKEPDNPFVKFGGKKR